MNLTFLLQYFQDLTSSLPSQVPSLMANGHPITLTVFGLVPRVKDLGLHMRRRDPAPVVDDRETPLTIMRNGSLQNTVFHVTDHRSGIDPLFRSVMVLD